MIRRNFIPFHNRGGCCPQAHGTTAKGCWGEERQGGEGGAVNIHSRYVFWANLLFIMHVGKRVRAIRTDSILTDVLHVAAKESILQISTYHFPLLLEAPGTIQWA